MFIELLFVDLLITIATDTVKMATAKKATNDVPDSASADPTQGISDDLDLLTIAASGDEAVATPHITTGKIRRTFNDNTQEFFAKLKQQQDVGRHCDFTIKTDEGVVHCHKVVLVASSSYLENIINKNTISYYEPDITKATLVKLLAWLYYSEVTINDVCIEELMKGAAMWKLGDLLENCADFICDNINRNNVCLFYQLSQQHCMDDIVETCSIYIREHYEVLNSTTQLEKLALPYFCEIISYNEINVANEKVIIDSVFRVLQTRPTSELLQMCYIMNITKFTEITRWDLVNLIMRYTRCDNLPKANKYNVVRQRRYWEELFYINSNYKLCKYSIITGGWIEVHALRKRKVDIYTAVAMSDNRMVMVGGESHRRITLLPAGQWDMTIPVLPFEMQRCGVTMEGNNVFIVGGQTDSHPVSYFNSAFCLEIYHVHGQLKPLKSMKHGMACPLVVVHKGVLYVIGGINDKRVQALDLTRASADWENCASIPEECDNTDSGVVICVEKITVFTTEYRMTYDEDTDQWFKEQYECQGDQLKAVFYRNNICALVKKDGKYCVKYYHTIFNEWKLMIADVPNVLFTGSIMRERRYIF